MNMVYKSASEHDSMMSDIRNLFAVILRTVSSHAMLRTRKKNLHTILQKICEALNGRQIRYWGGCFTHTR